MSPASRVLLRRALLAAIAVLYVLSVPWYRSAGADPGFWLGLPDWVAVALGCYVGVAVLNAAAWLLTEVPDTEAAADAGAADAGAADAGAADAGPEPAARPASPREDAP